MNLYVNLQICFQQRYTLFLCGRKDKSRDYSLVPFRMLTSFVSNLAILLEYYLIKVPIKALFLRCSLNKVYHVIYEFCHYLKQSLIHVPPLFVGKSCLSFLRSTYFDIIHQL